MIQRCENPKTLGYKNYGGRGIAVCSRWHKFENFLEDMGEMPTGLTIERLNNSDNYKPSNCKWATRSEQQNNKRPASRGPTKQYWFCAWHKNLMAQLMNNNQSAFARRWKLSPKRISDCLRGKLKQHKGWIFVRI